MDKKKAYVVANAHLDTVWRWTLSKTIKEFIPDTLTKNFELINKYPHYRFNFEGAYRYELIEEFYPLAFEKVKELIEKDRWCISGTAYENGDTNIPTPEALIRNILLGDKYFKEHFGKSSKDLFLPDCFGFSWVLPSVAAHCGLKGFTTQKLSWGSAYGIPFDIGIFKGPDGNSVYTSLNAKSYRYKFTGDIRADISIIDRIVDNAKVADLPWANHLYGTGDWGGSPTEESVMALEESVAKNNDSDFEIISAQSDQIFLDIDKLPKKDKEKLPVWNGELLMTSHGAGSYTSRAMGKRLNSQCEKLADYAEKACVMAYCLGDGNYPKKIFENAWKRVVRHQFHDDITGTSWMEVYNDAWNDYYLSLSQFKNEYLGASKTIHSQLDTSWVDDESIVLLVNNPTQFTHKGTVEAQVRVKKNCKYVQVYDKAGKIYPSQVTKKTGKNLTVVFQAEVDGFGFKAFGLKASEEPCRIETDVKVSNHTLENEKYKLIFNKNGDIAYLYDKKLGKQIIDAPIKMALFKDTGSLAYPSWEIRKEDLDAQPYCYANTPTFTVVEDGPVRVSIKVSREAEYSTIDQIVSLSAGGETVDVQNFVNWKTRRTLLKATFPLCAHNNKASYDLGLGVIERENNSSTLYEVPAQKWADITDKSGEFGVSVFSDCKHAWDKPNDNTLRLTCIHTPTGAFTKETRQDLQDLGRNVFSFAVFSHKNGYESETQKQSEIFANPFMCVQTDDKSLGATEKDSISLCNISNDNIIVRAIKQCEYDNSIIIRVNEAVGESQNNASLKLFAPIGKAQQVSGVEETIKELNVTKGGVLRFSLKPFEVKTFKLTLEKEPEAIRRPRYDAKKLKFNTQGFTREDNMRNVILQGSGFSLPIEKLEEVYEIGRIRFNTLQGKSQGYDTLVCRGQTINVKDSHTRLYMIAGSTLGTQDINIGVGKKQVSLRIKAINESMSKWDMAGLNLVADVSSNDTLAIEFNHTHHPEGNNTQKARFYLYSVNIKDADKITLPENNRVVILAMTTVREPYTSSLATKIEDTVSKKYSFDEGLPPIDKIIDKADFVTIRAGKIQDQQNGGRGKGFKRDNIITNIIRSYTKSEW